MRSNNGVGGRTRDDIRQLRYPPHEEGRITPSTLIVSPIVFVLIPSLGSGDINGTFLLSWI